jgi:hypothetical protein
VISTFKPKEVKKPKLATCKICKGKFVRTRPLQSLCLNLSCVVEYANRSAAKRERVDLKVRREAIKTPSDRAKPAQAAVNRYVNARDSGKPCISCGKPDRGVRNASHYKSRGSNSALRFNLWNIHSSCYSCNCEKSGNIGEYRPRLIDRIGAEKVEWLDCHPRSREYSPEYLKRLTRIFNKKTKRTKTNNLRAGE